MSNTAYYDWTVIGGGPAGIAAVCKILANTKKPPKVLWLDPSFSVGALGKLWSNVSGNTKVSFFSDFLFELAPFHTKKDYPLYNFDPNVTCDLKHIAEPLQEITHALEEEVQTERSFVTQLNLADSTWHIETSNQTTYRSQRVILATGALPLSLAETKEVIPLDIAIDKEKLAKQVDCYDKVAVYGASHSAILVLKHLCELEIEQVYNVYKSPCKYAKPIGDHILFDNTGLKGIAAEWAKQHIDGKLPANLKRIPFNTENSYPELKDANKIIHAIGFQPSLNITCSQYNLSDYCSSTGIIAPGLFGFGIAFPEKFTSPFGYTEYQVGLWKFITYLNRILPIWQGYSA